MMINASCVNGDMMKEYFVANHKSELDEQLQSKLGEYAEIVVNTVSNENGGDIELSLGVFNLTSELVNFSQEVAEKINNDKDYEYEDFTKKDIEDIIKMFIENNSLNIDIDWEEHAKMIHLFYNGHIYDSGDMDIYNETQGKYYMILDELYNVVCDFLNNTINQAIKKFNESWVYNYSAYEVDNLED